MSPTLSDSRARLTTRFRFNIAQIEKTLFDKKFMTAAPGDLNFLVNHLRELPEDARKFVSWAAFFGPTSVDSVSRVVSICRLHHSRFKVTEVALLMDWDDSSDSSGSGTEEEISKELWNVSKAVSTFREKEKEPSSTRRSIRGLQTAIAEGWLIQRARDMCSFSHDRYRQAAQAEAESQTEEAIAKMSFRVRSSEVAYPLCRSS